METVKQAYTLPLIEGMETLPNPPDKNPRDILGQLIQLGMRQRGLAGKPEYEEQIAYEKKVVQDKGLDVYFVIVWDIMREARKRGIATGFARGSAGGSLLCYVLQITEVDPLKYGLLFWRFLDPERNDTADIDLDFEDARRDEMKQYLAEKYGMENTGDIVTFTYFSTPSAIKAACRIMDVPFALSNQITKDFNPDSDMNEFRAVKYKQFHDKYPGVYKLAKHLNGRISGTGRHASAYVVSDKPLHEIVPVESRKVAGEDFRAPAIAYDWYTAEAMGFVKIDLLSIKNLTVVSNAVRMVKENHGKILDYKNLPEGDPAVLRMLSDGNTLGVFQAESPPSTSLIKRMKLDNFEDLVTSNALVRSGSWNAFGEEYLAVKKGHKRPKYPTENSKEFLEETYGFAIMQEQTMQICSKVAGMTDAESNQVRRLTSKKKDKSELLPYKEKFINGCVNNGVPQKEAEKLWANIETTAEYQFNKCLRQDTRVEIRIEIFDDDGDRDYLYEIMTVEEVYQHKVFRDERLFVRGPAYLKSGDAGGEEWYEIKDVHNNGVQDIVRVWIDENWYIDSTKTHKHRLSKGWREAGRIHQLDRIATNDGMKTVWKKTWEGQDQTYDLELYDEKHAFYANEIITHNSHAVGYSLLSYAEAWIKYYYPAEFMCALLNNEKDAGSTAEYLAECNRLGIPVRTPDVNKSGMGYQVKDGVIYMGLSNVKYISDKLAERLIHYRPYESYEDFKAKVMAKGSGLNSRVIDSLNKVGATEFWDHPIDKEACKKHYYEYLGIASLDNALITPNMQRKITPMNDYAEKSTAIIAGVVKDIVQKNNWIRVDFQDATGSTGFFVSPDHGFEKGKQYIVALAGGNPVGCVDMDNFDARNPIVRYLNSELNDGTWFLAAKARKTKTGKETATIMYSYNGKLDSCTVWSDLIGMARKYRPGQKIRIKVETSPKWGNTLKYMTIDDRE